MVSPMMTGAAAGRQEGAIMTELDDSADAVAGLVERLRQDADMLKDGYQRNLTELWHGVVVKDAAKACAAAADLLESQAKALSDAAAEWTALDLSHRSIGELLGREGRRRIAAEVRLKEAEKVIGRWISWCDDWHVGKPHPADHLAAARAFLDAKDK
jgi:hypothetical protein